MKMFNLILQFLQMIVREQKKISKLHVRGN